MSYLLSIFIGIGIVLGQGKPGESIEPPPAPDYIPTYYYLGF